MEDGLAFCRQDFIQLFYTVSELPPAPPQKKKNRSKTMTPPLPAVSLNWMGYQYVYNYLASFVKINELEKKGGCPSNNVPGYGTACLIFKDCA